MISDPTVPTTMSAVRLHPPGGIDSLSIDQVPTPRPEEGEILVRVHAAALTRDELDWPVERLPAIPSYELSGIVVGGDTSPFQSGQAVYGMTSFDRDGVAAEYASVPIGELSPKPESISHVEAAALPLPGLSAMQGLFDHGQLDKDQRVLIHGGAGGVGAYAVQLARLHGAYVITTVSTARIDKVLRLGADQVIDHTSADFTKIDLVDLVFDTAGGERLARSVEVLRPGGRLVSVAEDPPSEQASAASIESLWYLVETRQDQLAELARLADAGKLQIAVDRVYPMPGAGEAFTHLQDRGGAGKTVLTVGSEP